MKQINKTKINYLLHGIHRLAKAVEPLLHEPLDEFRYCIKDIALQKDVRRYRHCLSQGNQKSDTHDYEELFNLGLILMEALLYDYGVEWDKLELKMQWINEGQLDWQMWLDDEQVHFEM